ncbi:MAG: hypothetical protein ACKO3W_00955 [bacterium]
MTPPPVALSDFERTSELTVADTTATSCARMTSRPRAADRFAPAALVLECAWCVGRGGELALRLELPFEPGTRSIGELSLSPACTAAGHPLMSARERLVSERKRRWQVEARKISDGEYELVLLGVDAVDSSRLEASLATISRSVADGLEAAGPSACSTVLLTSIPAAIGLRGGTYVLRRVLVTTQA